MVKITVNQKFDAYYIDGGIDEKTQFAIKEGLPI